MLGELGILLPLLITLPPPPSECDRTGPASPFPELSPGSPSPALAAVGPSHQKEVGSPAMQTPQLWRACAASAGRAYSWRRGGDGLWEKQKDAGQFCERGDDEGGETVNRARGEHGDSRGDGCEGDEVLERGWGTRSSGMGALEQVGEEDFVLGRVEVLKPCVALGMEEGELSLCSLGVGSECPAAPPPCPSAGPGRCRHEAE